VFLPVSSLYYMIIVRNIEVSDFMKNSGRHWKRYDWACGFYDS